MTRAEPEHLSRNAVGAAPAPGHASGEEKAEKRSPFEGGWRVGSQGESGSDPLPGGGQMWVDSGQIRGGLGVGSGWVLASWVPFFQHSHCHQKPTPLSFSQLGSSRAPGPGLTT